MGWLFKRGYDKALLIQHLIKPEENEETRWETLAHSVRGKVLWSVMEVTNKQKQTSRCFIACHLLESHSDGAGWGYKDMDESMWPSYYSCPLKYLEMAPEISPGWRDEVRLYHYRRNRTLKVDQKISLVGASIPWVVITSQRPLQGVYEGIFYRIPRRMVGDVI